MKLQVLRSATIIVAIGTCIAMTARSRGVAASVGVSELASILGGQSGSCYQNVPQNNCPPRGVSPYLCFNKSCQAVPITCDEGGNMVTYNVYMCYADYFYFAQTFSYLSAMDLGQNAENGNSGTTPGFVKCGVLTYCDNSNDYCLTSMSSCEDNGFGTIACKTFNSVQIQYTTYTQDPNTPACPQPMSSLRRGVPAPLLATVLHNGGFYTIGY